MPQHGNSAATGKRINAVEKSGWASLWRQTVKVLPYTFFTVHTLPVVTAVVLWEEIRSGACSNI